MSGVQSWKDLAINSKVSALAAGFLLAIAVTKSSCIFPIVVYIRKRKTKHLCNSIRSTQTLDVWSVLSKFVFSENIIALNIVHGQLVTVLHYVSYSKMSSLTCGSTI